MNQIDELKAEHEEIERELLELEMITPENINYSNLVHIFRKVYNLWDKHEAKEEIIFPILKKNDNLIVPVDIMSFTHKKLKPHKDALINAVNSGSNAQVKKVLETDVKIIIKELRRHIVDEDNILYTIALNELNEKDFNEIEESLKKFRI